MTVRKKAKIRKHKRVLKHRQAWHKAKRKARHRPVKSRRPVKKQKIIIGKTNHDKIRNAIIEILNQEHMTASNLFLETSRRLKIDASQQMVQQVRDSLEEKGVIEKVPDTKPQLYRVKYPDK